MEKYWNEMNSEDSVHTRAGRCGQSGPCSRNPVGRNNFFPQFRPLRHITAADQAGSQSGCPADCRGNRASWLKFGNKGELKLLFAGDPVVFNQYAYLPINPAKHAHVKCGLAKSVEKWLTSAKAQAMIRNYRIAEQTLFTPNAKLN